MTTNYNLSAKKEPSRLANVFNILIAVLILFVGIVFAVTNIIGGLLVIIAGVIYLNKVKNLINQKYPFITSKVINIVSIVLIIGGIAYAMSADSAKRSADDWAKNSVSIIEKINGYVDAGNLTRAKVEIDWYEAVAKNNTDFQSAKDKYLAAEAIDKERRMEKIRKEVAAEQAAKNQSTSSSTSSSGGSGGRVVSKINDVIYFPTSEAVITRQTVLEINNQRIQNPDGSYIRVGDNCTYTNGYMGTATMYCTR